MPEKKKSAARPRYPTYSEIVEELKASGQYQDPMTPQVTMPAEHPGYVYETPDPLAQAAHFAARQEAARKLASPVSPVLELPEDAQKLPSPSIFDQLLAAWRARRTGR